jgi:hypothetical protein
LWQMVGWVRYWSDALARRGARPHCRTELVSSRSFPRMRSCTPGRAANGSMRNVVGNFSLLPHQWEVSSWVYVVRPKGNRAWVCQCVVLSGQDVCVALLAAVRAPVRCRLWMSRQVEPRTCCRPHFSYLICRRAYGLGAGATTQTHLGAGSGRTEHRQPISTVALRKSVRERCSFGTVLWLLWYTVAPIPAYPSHAHCLYLWERLRSRGPLCPAAALGRLAHQCLRCMLPADVLLQWVLYLVHRRTQRWRDSDAPMGAARVCCK